MENVYIYRRKVNKRKKMIRDAKRALTNFALTPARMPRITEDKVDRVMRICEAMALIFTALLIGHIASPLLIGTLPVVVSGIVFAGLLAFILLADYQDKLVEYELYGYKL